MEIILPRYNINRSTNFLIEDESWLLVEYDYTSVPGVIYLSLTENKVNTEYDKPDIDLADTDKLAVYKLAVPAEHETFKVNEPIIPTCTLLKSGQLINLELTYTSTDTKKAKVIDGVLTAIAPGEVTLIVSTKEFPHIQQECVIEIINNDEFVESAYIEGPDWIRLGRVAEYKLIITPEPNEPTIVFSIDPLVE